MARNEAKIKFTAETGEFTEQLSSANSALAALRAGLKLNDAELKNNGNQTEYLKNKQQLLETELQMNAQKQEALNGKLEAAKAIYGENSAEVQYWATKLTNAKTEQQQLEAQLNQCTQELEEQVKAEEKAKTPLEQLNTKIGEQKAQLEKLETEYKNVALEQGTGSKEAQELKGKIDQLNSELGENESKLKQVDDALESAGNEADKSANGGWSVLNQVIADLATNAIQQAINKLQDFAKETMNLGIDFSSSMSNVQAISGATGDEIALLEQKARDLGATTVYSASDVADGFGYMAMAGWDTQQMMDGIAGVLDLALLQERTWLQHLTLLPMRSQPLEWRQVMPEDWQMSWQRHPVMPTLMCPCWVSPSSMWHLWQVLLVFLLRTQQWRLALWPTAASRPVRAAQR